MPNEGALTNFALKLVTMASSIKEWLKEVQIHHLQTNTYIALSLGKKSRKAVH